MTQLRHSIWRELEWNYTFCESTSHLIPKNEKTQNRKLIALTTIVLPYPALSPPLLVAHLDIFLSSDISHKVQGPRGLSRCSPCQDKTEDQLDILDSPYFLNLERSDIRKKWCWINSSQLSLWEVSDQMAAVPLNSHIENGYPGFTSNLWVSTRLWFCALQSQTSVNTLTVEPDPGG